MPQTAASKPEKKKRNSTESVWEQTKRQQYHEKWKRNTGKGWGEKTLKRRLEDVMLQRNEKNRPRCHFDLFDFSLGEEGLFD